MSEPISRRSFAAASAGVILTSAANLPAAEDKPKGPIEATFNRDYAAPSFKPSWKKQQLNRLLVQDFVIYAHSDLEMTKKLVEKEPAVLNGFMDWGGATGRAVSAAHRTWAAKTSWRFFWKRAPVSTSSVPR